VVQLRGGKQVLEGKRVGEMRSRFESSGGRGGNASHGQNQQGGNSSSFLSGYGEFDALVFSAI
jgi:hypothetical protein